MQAGAAVLLHLLLPRRCMTPMPCPEEFLTFSVLLAHCLLLMEMHSGRSMSSWLHAGGCCAAAASAAAAAAA